MRKPLLVLAVALLAAAAATAPASASRYLQSGIFDDAQILYGDPDKVFPILDQVDTDVIRVNLWWGGPNGVARRRPARPSDPADPAYDWATYDRTVRYAAAYRMKTVFSVVGTPPWANRAKGWNVAPADPADLQLFVQAAARRYAGTFPGPDGKRLPAVRQWLAWNEPNNPVFLKPQWKKVAGGGSVIQSAIDYAGICNAVVAGVRASQRGAKIACGVTGPRGNNNPNSTRASVAPIAFLRAMRNAGAKGFDAYAHHPYYGTPRETPSTPPPPGVRGQPPTAVTLGNIEVLVRELTRAYGNMRIWVTEYGYQTNPPDRLFGVSYVKQAAYLGEAYTIVRRHPRIDMFLWFLLRDEERAEGWQSGLYTAKWARKPAREIFERRKELPLSPRRTGSR